MYDIIHQEPRFGQFQLHKSAEIPAPASPSRFLLLAASRASAVQIFLRETRRDGDNTKGASAVSSANCLQPGAKTSGFVALGTAPKPGPGRFCIQKGH